MQLCAFQFELLLQQQPPGVWELGVVLLRAVWQNLVKLCCFGGILEVFVNFWPNFEPTFNANGGGPMIDRIACWPKEKIGLTRGFFVFLVYFCVFLSILCFWVFVSQFHMWAILNKRKHQKSFHKSVSNKNSLAKAHTSKTKKDNRRKVKQ